MVYSLAIEAVVSGDFSPAHAALRFVLSAVLAVVIGIALGWLNARLAGMLEDPTQQVALNLRAAAEVEQEMIAASRREVLRARGELGADPEIADQVMRGLDLRSRRK
ncbi:hypothetical protein P3T39_003536 [Kitasatospora sp. GP82]|nr:hypothetical protein [Kitasatospora sp. GP82]